MKINRYIYFILVGFLVVSCASQKNTSKNRALKALNTRYNVFFNGKNSYDEGLKNINQANVDDYSSPINLYAISKHENANAAKSSMERTIDKCRKAIKLYSIKQKPERNNRKWNDPEYQAWYNQKEFNPALKDAWLLLGQAEFHKGDFLGSVGTFTYVSRYYNTDKSVVTQCQLWMTRAYAEMGWIYEAEQMLMKLKQNDLTGKTTGLYAAVSADLLLKKRQYKESIPYLELALKTEKDKVQKQRMTYLLAQLYQKNGLNTEAFNAYSQVLKFNPPYEMDFNARIYRAELNTNVVAVRKELNKMILNPNNKDYKDQLYYVLGKTYLQQGDTVKAIENFEISADTSTRKAFDLAKTLITLGDLYYNKQNYLKAQPCYDEASKILTVDHVDYTRVSKRAETLGEAVTLHQTVVLQDSLQHLATLPVDKQKAIVQKIIDKLIADEKAAEDAEKRLANQNKPQNFDDNFDMMPPLGMAPVTGDWYFYNPQLIKTGASDFRKKWGTRKLEDNWRRTNKSAALFADAPTATQRADAPQDSVAIEAEKASSDNKNPAFYLSQIPVTDAQMAKSNEELANALFDLGFVYKDKVEDYPLAVKTFDEFERRFPADKRLVETLYNAFVVETKLENTSRADFYKAKLIQSFPDSKYVEVLSQPDYFERMERMYREQDSLYALTYKAYNASKFDSVKVFTTYMEKTYPLSKLLPKFQFLNALSVGKTDKPEVFEKSLSTLVEKYPQSDVSAMAKDILALIMQGNEAKKGTSHGSLLARRDDAIQSELPDIAERKFIVDKTGKHRLMIVFNSSTERLNKLLFNVAAFNFTRFMLKDFDMIPSKLDSARTVLSVTGFESSDEVAWYTSSVKDDAVLNGLLTEPDVEQIIVSDVNFSTLFSYLGLDAYKKFLATGQNEILAEKPVIAAVKPTKKTAEKPVVKPTVASVQEKPKTPVVSEPVKEALSKKETEKQPVRTETMPAETAVVQPKPVENKPVETKSAQTVAVQQVVPTPVPDVPLFKNLFGYRANEAHFVAITVLSGEFDFVKLKAAFDAFNAKNYSMLNLKVSNDTFGKQKIIIIGSFADAHTAKSYLFRIVNEDALYEPIKNTNYRNLIGSQKNLNVMMQQNAMETYFEFMQEYYLK